MENNLVFDIGAHKGDDTVVYLSLGFNVVAVEANPYLIEVLKRRFEGVEGKRLAIVHGAVTAAAGNPALLFLHEDSSQSSLVHKSGNAGVRVPAKTLAGLINDFGVPRFCKIDIEGSDLDALQSLQAGKLPAYVSVEICGTHLKYLEENCKPLFFTLDCLKSAGYSRFMLVDQERLQVLGSHSFYKRNLTLQRRMEHKIFTFLRNDARSRFLATYKLEKEAEVSGLPGFLLGGRWSSYDETRKLIQFHFNEFLSVVRSKDLIFWVDLHAAF